MTTADRRSEPQRLTDAEGLYLRVRQAEGRVLSPEALKKLPWVPPGDPYADEWLIRAATAGRLIGRLRRRFAHPRILDVGCGPGWMTAQMVRELKGTAVGIDCNRSEIERGSEAFSAVEGLDLRCGDIFEPVVEAGSFDAIIIAAALQYFQDPQALLHRFLELLKSGGEILIADSPFYPPDQVEAAAQRTLQYYTALGFPEMAAHYHHHSMDDLAGFSPITVYDPKALVSRVARRWFGRPLSPFPILAILAGGKP